jgi:hypothetical protein
VSWWRADGRIRIVVLRSEGIEPSPRRLESSWKEFLHRQAASILECDFLTVDTVFLKRFDILFVIELQSRRVHLAGITANPDAAWVTQQARNLLMQLDDEGVRARFLIRDRDSKFTRDFDAVFRSEGIRVIKAPVRAPRATSTRRALDRQFAARVPRPAANCRPTSPRTRGPHLRGALQRTQATPLARSAAAAREAADRRTGAEQ